MPEPENGGTARRDFIRKAGGALGAGAALAVTATAVTGPAVAASPGAGITAFNDVGSWTYLAPGASTHWWLSFGGNPGALIAMPDVKTIGVRHNGSNFGKAIFSGYTEYYVTVTNVGGAGAYHNMQGGGFV